MSSACFCWIPSNDLRTWATSSRRAALSFAKASSLDPASASDGSFSSYGSCGSNGGALIKLFSLCSEPLSVGAPISLTPGLPGSSGEAFVLGNKSPVSAFLGEVGILYCACESASSPLASSSREVWTEMPLADGLSTFVFCLSIRFFLFLFVFDPTIGISLYLNVRGIRYFEALLGGKWSYLGH